MTTSWQKKRPEKISNRRWNTTRNLKTKEHAPHQKPEMFSSGVYHRCFGSISRSRSTFRNCRVAHVAGHPVKCVIGQVSFGVICNAFYITVYLLIQRYISFFSYFHFCSRPMNNKKYFFYKTISILNDCTPFFKNIFI